MQPLTAEAPATAQDEREICRHCHRKYVNRPRGLCWSCYYSPGMLDRYPSTSKYARRGVGNVCGNRPAPAAPTEAEPGSEEKVRVLTERAARHEQLWHPADRRTDGPPLEFPMIRESLNGDHNAAAAEAPACPQCRTAYRNPGYKRCHVCNPPKAGGRRPKQTQALRPVRTKILPAFDLSAAMTAADAVRQAVAGLDPATARQVLGWVGDRLAD